MYLWYNFFNKQSYCTEIWNILNKHFEYLDYVKDVNMSFFVVEGTVKETLTLVGK